MTRRFGAAIGYVLVVAVATHVVTIAITPRLVTGLVIRGASLRFGTNQVYGAPRVDAANQRIVRPSPDLAYSLCSVDLEDGPVEVVAPIGEAYLSVAVYAANSDNVFAMNDRQADGAVRVVVHREGEAPRDLRDVPLVAVPTSRAFVLIRRVILDDAHFERLDRLRERESCGPLSTGRLARRGG